MKTRTMYFGMLLLATLISDRVNAQSDDSFEKSELWRRIALAKAYSSSSATGEGLDVTYYKLDIALVASPPSVKGTVTMIARATKSLSSFSLDLTPSLTVDSARVNGRSASVTRSSATISLDAGIMLPKDSAVTVEITYHGLPDTTQGSIMYRTTTGGAWIWTLSEPYGARDWWPCKDHPADKADSLDVWVRAASNLKVGSEGILEAVIDNGDGTKTHRWKHRYPISTYLVSLAAAPYAEFTNWFKYTATDSMPVLNYVLPGVLTTAQAQLPVTVRALEIFSDKYGLYPFVKEKYGHAQFAWGGGMEHQTMTSLISFGEGLVVHELAHQWFGDMITMETWPHLWLNEGFATYSEALHNEAKYGTTSYKTTILNRRSSARAAQGSVILQDTSNFGGMFDSRRVYSKGSWILHMLRGVIGDSLFFAGVKAYAVDPRFRFKNATTEQFRAVMESVSGKDLGFFFTQWLYGERYPLYTYSWRWDGTTTGQVLLTIDQSTGTSNPAFFTMPITVAIYKSGVRTSSVIQNSAAHQTFSLPYATLPDSVSLDPDHWILRDLQRVPSRVMDRLSLPERDVLLEAYPNPFNPATTVTFRTAERGSVRIAVYDLLGREVALLVDGVRSAGISEVTWNAAGVASGSYLVIMKTDRASLTQKIVLTK